MTYQPYPYPSPEPLKRLRIHDDLIINAERWQFAHNYHRQRQNLVYQSLHQPGIIAGLGVKAIEQPENVSERAKQRRWIEIQPGIAIDIYGNPIIVDRSTELMKRCYPIAATSSSNSQPLTIYIVIQYRDPDKLDPDNLELRSNPEKISEGFRLSHSTQPPIVENGEVELCRIQLQPGFTMLENPKDPLSPKINQIDLRYRIQAQSRSLAGVRIGAVSPVTNPNQVNQSLRALVESLPALFPTLQGTVDEKPINLSDKNLVITCDLLYLSSQTVSTLHSTNFNILKQYLDTGGTIMIEADVLTSDLEQHIQKNLLSPSESLSKWENLQYLSKEPFLFTKLPCFNKKQIDMKVDVQGRVILVTEPFSNACRGVDLARHDIRTAHELGINILHFAWRRRHFSQLLQ